MRLPKGVLKKLKDETGIKTTHLSGYAGAQRRPGRERSVQLESACSKLGLSVPKELWLFGSSKEIKSALSKSVLPL